MAAIGTAVLFALDPTLLAHASIVKNDVAMSLVMLALVAAVSQAAKRLTVINALAISLICAAGMNVKFSGVLLPVIAATTLTIRALLPAAWKVLGRDLRSRSARIAVVAAELLCIGVVFVAVTWTAYGFRYAASSLPDDPINFDIILANQAGGSPFAPAGDVGGAVANSRSQLPVRMILSAARHRLLPEAYLAGFLNLRQLMRVHQNYLLGEVRETGWPYYFELAMLFKSPLATICAAMLAAGLVIVPRTFRMLFASAGARAASERAAQVDGWSIVCMAIATGTYLLSTLNVNLNSGVRHMLPIFPLVFVAIAVVAARAMVVWPRAGRIVAGVLLAALAAETLRAYPDFIAFFNRAAGGARGGFRLLGDSNLDWGQDLPLLAQWQREHPNEKLYLCYFGAADPAFYGVRYINLPGGFILGPPVETVTTPGVIAMSVTRMQGVNTSPQIRAAYRKMWNWPVRQSLGGSIYLFDYPPPGAPAPDTR